MLTDEELDRVASVHASTALGPRPISGDPRPAVVAERRFSVTNPPGAYYLYRVLTEQPDERLLGSGGFFVDQRTGAIRDFGSGEVLYTAAAFAAKAGRHFDGDVGPDVVQYLLTHPQDMKLLREGFDAFLYGPRRSWWRFWR